MKTIKNHVTGHVYKIINEDHSDAHQVLEMEVTYPAHSTQPFRHYHPFQTEYFKIIEGELKVRLGADLKIFRKGEKFIVPPNTDHSMWNDSASQTIVSWKVDPALRTLAFFEKLTNAGIIGSKGIPSFFQKMLLLHDFSDEIRVSGIPFIFQQLIFICVVPVARLFKGTPASNPVS